MNNITKTSKASDSRKAWYETYGKEYYRQYREKHYKPKKTNTEKLRREENERNLYALSLQIQACSNLIKGKSAMRVQGLVYDTPEDIAEMIINTVCEGYKVTLDELKVMCRRRVYLVPRQLAMRLIRKYTNYSLEQVAALFNRTDHTTVIHAVKCIDNLTKYPSSETRQILSTMKVIQYKLNIPNQ